MKLVKIKMFFAWYDLWIGAYWSSKDNTLYICPFFCIVVKLVFNHIPKRLRKAKSWNNILFFPEHYGETVYHIVQEDPDFILNLQKESKARFNSKVISHARFSKQAKDFKLPNSQEELNTVLQIWRVI